MRLDGAEPDWSPWLLHPESSGVLTDYDGTLAPIVEDLDAAAPLPGVRDTLQALARIFQVVGVVSGRPLPYLAARLGGIERLRLAGLSGFEQLLDGRRVPFPKARRWESVIQDAARRARTDAPSGVEVENKGLVLALHCRRAPRQFAWVEHRSKELALSSGLAVLPGRLSVELRPPVGVDKGTIVEQWGKQLSSICFFGDDTGDLPAFAALHRLRATGRVTLAVGIASPEAPQGLASSVDLMVGGPEEALQLLRRLGTR